MNIEYLHISDSFIVALLVACPNFRIVRFCQLIRFGTSRLTRVLLLLQACLNSLSCSPVKGQFHMFTSATFPVKYPTRKSGATLDTFVSAIPTDV